MPYHPASDPGDLPTTSYGLTTEAGPAAGRLTGDASADVAVIGGGITGASLALHAAEAGADVALLEAHEIGWGSSGRNFGQVVPYLRHEAEHALAHFGPTHGQRLVAATGEGPDLVFDLIRRHAIACDANRSGLIFAAHAPGAIGKLERRARFWAEKGVTLPLLDAKETARLVGGGRYPAALLEPRGGTINPLAYTRGLAAAAARAGARLHAQTPVTSLRRAADRWIVTTPGGTVTADSVVLATNAYTRDLWPGLAASLVPVRAYQLTSRPLGENVRRTILPEGHAVTDTRRMTSGVRMLPGGRLHVTADGARFGARERVDVAAANRRVAQLYPHLGPIEWEFRWSGWLAMTRDEYPHLHALAPGLFAVLGYSGRGLALATILGREMARHLAGTPATDLVLPFTAPKRIGFAGANQIAAKTVIAWKRFRDGWDMRTGV